ncbi:aldehyde dehydrogenase family protein [Klebsiella pneumoniae subsp. pneumoniae]|nr:aldehyde dehydrogenase family protein [Klebsiella pneumoniae subsp. pneumoniae]
MAKHLLEQKDQFYAISAQTGATRADSWVDIEGGIGTLFTYAGLGSRELPDDILWPEDELIPLSKQGGFAARHVLTSKSGVAVHINAFNFPCWGMLEKLAPTWLAGMPAIIKPATATAQLTQAMVKAIVDSGLVPEGAISLICGGAGDLLDHLDSRDVVTFTGSAATGQQLRAHPNPVAKSIPFTMGSRFTQLLRVRRRRHSGATGIRAVYSGSGPRDDGESRAKMYRYPQNHCATGSD